MNKGLTLIELIITVVLLFMLMAAVAYVFRAVLSSWASEEKRAGIDIAVDRAIEQVVRDLRKAREIQSSNDEIRFTQDGAAYYIFYFYNANDTYPPSFNHATYQLRKATLTGGIGGVFTYGSGQVIIIDVIPPAASDLSVDSNLINLDLTIRRGGETIRSKSQVRPRNL